jgi:hypothetical protein
VLLDREKALRANEAGPTDFAAFTIAIIQRDGERIPVPAAGDLAQNQIRAWKICDDQSGTALVAATTSARERYDNDFACYRFDHAASSSGEFQSRPRTDSLSSAPLNASSRACSGDSLPIDSRSCALTGESLHVNGISDSGNRIPERYSVISVIFVVERVPKLLFGKFRFL